MKFYFLLISVLMMSVASTRVLAQNGDDYGGAVYYGYTSIDLDPDSEMVTAYSETTVDPSIEAYYSPIVAATVSDSKGNQLGGGQYGGDRVSYSNFTLQVKGVPGVTYTIGGYHTAFCLQRSLEYPESIVGKPNCESVPTKGAPSFCGPPPTVHYLDPFYFGIYDGLDISEYGGYEFFGPGPSANSDTQNVGLGSTTDSASTTVPAACGDVRDELIKEYGTFHSPFQPKCRDFINPEDFSQLTGGSVYSYEELTPDQTTGAPDFAVIQRYALVSELNSLSEAVGSSHFTINSGYRNPAAEVAAAKKNHVRAYLNSRHLAGDAVDISTTAGPSYWQAIHDTAKRLAVPGCVEPVAAQGNSRHLHIDWRILAHTDRYTSFPWNGSCPHSW